MNRLLLTGCALFLFAPIAQAFTLQWPVKCQLGQDCFVQNYVDHGPAPTTHDFTCANLTYPAHDGTDIRLRNLAAMREGVPVVAPADGTVIGVRDGMADQSIRTAEGTIDKSNVESQECGNGVHLQHADGYRTQLCHMRKGSITVHPGDEVHAGDAVGMVGLSGQTEFPHTHITVWKDDRVIDPFTTQPMQAACQTTPSAATLWAAPVPYIPSALLGDGFMEGVPDKTALRDTPVNRTSLPASTEIVSYWADVMGIHTGDTLTLRITDAKGQPLVDTTKQFDHPSAAYFIFIGKKTHGQLPPGHYFAALALVRITNGVAKPVVTSAHELIVN